MKFWNVAPIFGVLGLSVLCLGFRLNDLQRQEILDAHNWARDRVPIDFPEYAGATCIPHVEWDYYIEEVAQAYADSCCEGHSADPRYEDGSSLGENLAWQSWRSEMNYSVLAWYREVSGYDPSLLQYDHYTQVVWNGTTRIGCGVAYGCEGWYTTFVCNYWPSGNFLGRRPWTPAKLVNLTPVKQCETAHTLTVSRFVITLCFMLIATSVMFI